MAAIEIEFKWYRDPRGYDLLPEVIDRSAPAGPLSELLDGPSGAWRPQRVARRGGQLEAYEPLTEFDSLYTQFLKVDTPAHVLDFVERFGPLTQRGTTPGGYDDVKIVILHACAMRAFLAQKNNPEETKEMIANIRDPLSTLDLRLVWDHAKKQLAIRFRPRSLIVGLWLQFTQSLASGTKVKTCPHCGILFAAGPGTGQREDAKYCCRAHQEARKSLRRSRHG